MISFGGDEMEQHLKDSITSGTEGSTKLQSTSTVGNVGSNAWGIPSRTGLRHPSTDTSLFSSSLPVLSHEKLNFNDLGQFGQSIDDGSPSITKFRLEDEDAELNEIGSLLPDDEDELLAGIMEDFDLSELPSQVEDLEEDDLFGSGGGMELDFDNNLSKLSLFDGVNGNGGMNYGLPNGVGTVAGEHPYGEHPSRTLFVRNINSNVEDSELRALFEQYGDIRTLYTACKHRGFVMISYYDIRDARTAMRALQNKPLRRRKLDIHFSIPKDNPSEKDINQGTLVIFNLDASVSNDELRLIFGAYGEVKEIRETPHKHHHRFIEYYDVRAAELALKALNRCDIAGKRIKLEPSRPGGARRNLMQQLSQELEQDEARNFLHQVGSPVMNSPPGTWPQFSSPIEHSPLHSFNHSPGSKNLSPINGNHLPGLASILPHHISNTGKVAPIGKEQGRINTDPTQPLAYHHSHSFPDLKLSLSPLPVSSFDESNSTFSTLSGPQFLWGSPTPYSNNHTNSSSPWPPLNASNGYRQGGFNAFMNSPQYHHVGSAPSVLPFDRHFGFFPESPKTAFIDLNRSSGGYLMNMGSPNFRMMSLPRPGPFFLGNEGLSERSRSRRAENSGNQMENKMQYQLELDKIISGEDTRTTLMIKNIPNKYTSKMLLAAIDENHRGTYDFLYLPIDFKNKCNVGYAFINMVSPSHIIPFYEAFNGKKWEKFNSEKVASLAYARIQGKAALVSHFQNSSLMNEDKRCRPILFHSEGLENGDQEPLPTNNLNVCIRQPDGSYCGDPLDSPKSTPEEKPDKINLDV